MNKIYLIISIITLTGSTLFAQEIPTFTNKEPVLKSNIAYGAQYKYIFNPDNPYNTIGMDINLNLEIKRFLIGISYGFGIDLDVYKDNFDMALGGRVGYRLGKKNLKILPYVKSQYLWYYHEYFPEENPQLLIDSTWTVGPGITIGKMLWSYIYADLTIEGMYLNKNYYGASATLGLTAYF